MHGNTKPIIDALKPLIKDADFKVRHVGHAANFASVKVNTRTVPCIYVINASDLPVNSEASTTSCDIEVLSKEVFAVVIGVSNTDSQRSDKDNAQMIELRKKVRQMLRAFKPTGNFEKMQWAGGKMMTYNDHTLWYEDRFSSTYFG